MKLILMIVALVTTGCGQLLGLGEFTDQGVDSDGTGGEGGDTGGSASPSSSSTGGGGTGGAAGSGGSGGNNDCPEPDKIECANHGINCGFLEYCDGSKLLECGNVGYYPADPSCNSDSGSGLPCTCPVSHLVAYTCYSSKQEGWAPFAMPPQCMKNPNQEYDGWCCQYNL